ncbi:MAG: hypothetical protein ABUL48_04205 [Pseudorhodoplanes sp.]
MASAAFAGGDCRFPKTKPVSIKNDMGPCKFDPDLLRFAGDPAQQAACLLTPVEKFGKLGSARDNLPDALARFVGTSTGLPDREGRRRLLQELQARGLDKDFGTGLDQPVAFAQKDDFTARSATYFVIHDTSSPNYLSRPWPSDIDSDKSINNLDRYACANKIERAHVFINRTGEVMLAHDLDVAWRATKFEMAIEFGSALRGLFLHTELIQPRRREPGRGWANDFQAPSPGFSAAQYDALALIYTVASTRAGLWMIPAFHAVIDEGIWDKHDDPQNFDLAAFADSLEKLRARLQPASTAQSN